MKKRKPHHLVGEYLKSKNNKAKVFVVHRLDKDTSGVLDVSKNEIIESKLQQLNEIVCER